MHRHLSTGSFRRLILTLMWFSEKSAVCVDTRTAALAVYKAMPSGPRLLRFAFEKFDSRARVGAPFSDVLAGSRESIQRLAAQLKAPAGDATLLLPIGAAFPAVVDMNSVKKAQSGEIDEVELLRFRLAPLLPFPVSEAEVRSESLAPREGVVLGQAIPKSAISEGERVMASLGFPRVRVASALSAALRGLTAAPNAVDLIFGDSACAIAVRNQIGLLESIHLRLLVEGDDRIQRSIDEALRAASAPRLIRVLGEDGDLEGNHGRDMEIRPAFGKSSSAGVAYAQSFPFLALFENSGRP